MNSRRERPAAVLAGLTALFAIALGLVACEGSPEPPEFPLGEEPTAQPGATAGSTAGGDCCACTVTNTRTIDDPRLPCQFDIPGDWQVGLGRESGMLSAMAGRQSCDTICPSGMPYMSVSYGTQADANAATMQGIWKMGMREIGTALFSCGKTGGWLRYRDLFIESFTDIPDSSFPE